VSTIIQGTKDAIELNAIPKDEIEAKIKAYEGPAWMTKLAESGGLMALLAPLGLAFIIFLLVVLIKCFKRCSEKSEKFRKLVKAVH